MKYTLLFFVSGSDITEKILRHTSRGMSRPASNVRRATSSDILLRRINKAEQATMAAKALKSHLEFSEQILGLNFETIPKKVKEEPIEDESKNKNKSSTPSTSPTKRGKSKSKDRNRKPNLRMPRVKRRATQDEDEMPDMRQVWKLDIQIEQGTNTAGHVNTVDKSAIIPCIKSIEYDNVVQINNNDIVSCISAQTEHSLNVIEAPKFKYKNTCAGYYRYDNGDLVRCIASDPVAGRPFERYLQYKQDHDALNALHFIFDAQQYLMSKVHEKECIGEYIKFRRARTLMTWYLVPGVNKQLTFLPTGAAIMLDKLLPSGKGDYLISDAQDLAFEVIVNVLYFDWIALIRHWIVLI